MTTTMVSELDVRAVGAADVFKAGRLAGQLRRTESGDVEFVYDPGYLRLGRNGPPVAVTLPKRPESYVAPAGAVPRFFAGLLPEGLRLQAVAAHVKTSVDDMLSLLLAVGADTVGDVQVLPAGEVPLGLAPMVVHARGWADVSFQELLAMSVGGAIDRVGLPGVQDKMSGSMISFPAATTTSRFIIKLSPSRYPRLVENEHFFLRAARRARLRAAPARLVTDRDSAVGLLVTRFDRVVHRNGGDSKVEVRLVEQEDACQLLDRWPADKYRLSTEEVIEGVSRQAAAPLAAAAELFRLFAFSYAIGNGDLHAKNVSLYREPSSGLLVPTPVYDLVSTSPYGDHDMALPVAGHKTGLSRRRWLQLADAVGLPARSAQRILDEVIRSTESWLGDLIAIGLTERQTHKLTRTIDYRRRELSND